MWCPVQIEACRGVKIWNVLNRSRTVEVIQNPRWPLLLAARLLRPPTGSPAGDYPTTKIPKITRVGKKTLSTRLADSSLHHPTECKGCRAKVVVQRLSGLRAVCRLHAEPLGDWS